MDVTQVVTAAGRVLGSVAYGFLTTSSGAASPSVRMVQHLQVDEDLRVILATGRHTRKAAEMSADPAVVYAVADLTSGAACCLYGTAQLDDDLDRRRSAWIPALAPFFPDGPEGPEFVLVSIEPQRVEMWSAGDRIQPAPFGLNSAAIRRRNGQWEGPDSTHPDTAAS